ncbi:MAG: tRNA uridine-5-carboxymethylaminomethyl(34) synthesis GTPase MnmE [Sphingomicrobium sp.]
MFALSSGRPPCAVAVIRTSGADAFAAAEALCGALPPPRQARLRAARAGNELIDQCLVLRFDRPASATGENVIEYQCHGARAVVDAMLAALGALTGMRAAEPGEFTRRAFANGRIDLTEAEGLADLLEAETESQRRAALRNAEGGLRRQVELWRETVVMLSARAEAAIDYVGDGDETAADERGLASEALALADELAAWLARPRTETLKDGIRVVAAGPPNAGKSSLINALAGFDRAIVTSIPGTTRDVIEVPLAIGGVPFVLVDTAGLRASDDAVEQIGVARAEAEARDADILLWLGDPAAKPAHARLIEIHPRADLAGRCDAPAGSIAISSTTGAGMPGLVDRLIAIAYDMLPTETQVSLNRRQADCLSDAERALHDAASGQIEITADAFRRARAAFDRVTGRSGVEDMLDALFGRFCLGK